MKSSQKIHISQLTQKKNEKFITKCEKPKCCKLAMSGKILGSSHN